MEKKGKRHQKWVIAVGIIVILLVIVFAIMLQGEFNFKANENIDDNKYNSFVSDLSDYVSSLDSQMDYTEAKMNVISKIIDLQKKYGNSEGGAYVANKLINNTSIVTYASTKDYLNAMALDLSSLFGGLFGGSDKPDKTLTMRSTTVCDGGKVVNSSDYCTDDLKGKVYITDKKSNKWVVLVHAFTLSGEQIYNALGEMYTSQGYNVLAPDLRQSGDSGGTQGMSYMESLDIYDWIKYLNEKPSDFGVSVSPKSIIVHGVSLGGATTLQLATNPDIAGKVGTTYTKTLGELNVKGFVDDCGYTSMTGVISDMLSSGDTDTISTISGYLNLDEDAFPKAIQEAAESLNIDGLGNIDFSEITNGKDFSKYFNQFSEVFNGIADSSGTQSGSQYTIPSVGQSGTASNWWSQRATGTSSVSSGKVTLVENDLLANVKDVLVRKAIMNLVKVGLDDSNFDKYQNAFSSGRTFPSGSKVLIIHGTGDTIVSHNNADTVAANIGSADLFYKWDVPDAPHAFIIMGSEKEKYTNLVASFTKYVETGVKNSDVFSSNSSTNSNDGSSSSSGISGIWNKITGFFSGLFGKK